jgi:hypothetical protein
MRAAIVSPASCQLREWLSLYGHPFQGGEGGRESERAAEGMGE